MRKVRRVIERSVKHERLASAFSPAVLRDMARSVPRQIDQRLLPIAALAETTDATLAECFAVAWSVLASNYRSEYYYKSQVISKIVFGRHSPRTTTPLFELPMGKSCADLVIINGTSTTYEIKTDFDSFRRLDAQLMDYRSRTEFVNVVVSERRAATAIGHVPEHVGVVALRRNGALTVAKPATSQLGSLDSDHMFLLMRTDEARHAVQQHGGAPPTAPGVHAWKEMRAFFANLPPAVAHRLVIDQLRTRSASTLPLVLDAAFPPSLRAAAYTTGLSGIAQRRLMERLRSPADCGASLAKS